MTASRYTCALLLALTACSDDELTAARARWDSQRVTTYHFTWQHTGCLCEANDLRKKRINVVFDALAGAVYLDSSEAVDLRSEQVRTIDGVFDWLEKTRADGVARLDVTYDPVQSYPISIFRDLDAQFADDEDTWYFGDLVNDKPDDP